MTRPDLDRHDRMIGVLLLVAAALTVFAMAHHPSGTHGGSLVYLVHGAMLVLLSLVFFGFCHYSLRRGLDRPLILGALVAYGLSYVSHVIAGTINGFIVPVLAARGGDIPHALFVAAWESNQAFARVGTVATGVAFALWGVDLLRHGTGLPRLAGAFGIVAGVIPMALLLKDTTMDVPAALTIYSLHSVFVALVAVLLIRRLLPQGA